MENDSSKQVNVLAPFPRRRWLTDADRIAIEKADSLRLALEELIWRVHSLWLQQKEDEKLAKANMELHFAGIGTQDFVIVIGRFVLKPARYYFDARDLLSEESESFLRSYFDLETTAILDTATRLDREIRALIE